MKRGDLPDYDEHEQGLDQDYRVVPDSSKERSASAARYHGSREGLIARLNGGDLLPDGPHPGQPTAPENTDPGPLRAVIYLRVSTEEQAKVGGTAEGYSIPYQRRACHDKAEQLQAVVVEEYVDLGESAKSSRRPELQRMLRELTKRGVSIVIVHKIDRLARNARDDYEINTAIAAAGARLVSVSEHIDETPAGRLNHVIQAGVAQYHSDNLRFEVMKGLTTKVESGGTPYRTPMGYLNKQEITDNIIIRSVEVDPERAPLVRWAFTEYATGNWTLLRLQQALTEKGLRTRKTAKQGAKPISVNGLYSMLRNPYYMGVVPYRGAYHDGSHPALIDAETWLQAQAVFAAHNTAGEKDRTHPHYLKGSIWCGECGARLIYSRNRGRGGVYEYFFCLNRKMKRRPCQRGAVRVGAVAAGVEDFYRSFQLKPERAAEIREGVLTELEAERDQATHDHARATHRLASLTHERKAVLQAHYTGAIPLDLLKEEMDRLTREMAEAERLTRDASKTVDELDLTLHQALTVASTCHQQYLAAPPHIRRQINQGFFTRLLIAPDGSVERFELTEPFAALLADTSHETVERTQSALDAPGTVPATETPPTTPRRASGDQDAAGHHPTNVLVTTFEEDQELSGDLVTAGVKEASLVHLTDSLSNPTEAVTRLVVALGERGKPENMQVSGTTQDAIVAQAGMTDAPGTVRLHIKENRKLSSAELVELVDAYKAGASQAELTRRFGLHEQTVRAHLRRQGVSLRPLRVLTEAQEVEVMRLYVEETWSLAELAARFEVGQTAVRNVLVRRGAERRAAARRVRTGYFIGRRDASTD